ncbi:hypothetical protein BBD39_09185 [Arsenophonus endosymbiont of Bemisia tabaci Asia II 3]|nr:hypothetical protein BBD39_09185 [Arsenophonus endosymbiont of Bemisia tabaci Asia II 3]
MKVSSSVTGRFNTPPQAVDQEIELEVVKYLQESNSDLIVPDSISLGSPVDYCIDGPGPTLHKLHVGI